jgi:uncharacterized protein YidB (DUF937 family)
MTEPEYWIDLTFGMTEGWWRFEDRVLRTSSPLMESRAWVNSLAANGFEAPAALPVPFCPTTLLLARRPMTGNKANGAWLILGDRAGVGAGLAERLTKKGGACTIAAPGQSLRQVVSGTSWRGIADLRGLDAPNVESLTSSQLLDAEAGLCTGLADLARILAEGGPGEAPRLWVVTSNSQAVTGREQSLAIVQAPLWGAWRWSTPNSGVCGSISTVLPKAPQNAFRKN